MSSPFRMKKPVPSAKHKKPEQDDNRDEERKTRKCLVCKAEFVSEWAGERICHKCKSSSNWRSGLY